MAHARWACIGRPHLVLDRTVTNPAGSALPLGGSENLCGSGVDDGESVGRLSQESLEGAQENYLGRR